MFERIPRRLTAATVALACFGSGAGLAAGVHKHRVNTVVAQARETAQLVEASRASLESSYTRAVEASSDAAEVAANETVAEAATDLRTIAAEAERTAAALKVTIETPDVESALAGEDGEGSPEAATGTSGSDGTAAEPAPSASPEASASASANAEPSPSPEPSASSSADTAEDAADGPDGADVVDDARVRDVLEGRVTDIATVEETIAQLEEAAATLEAHARRVDGSAAQLEEAAAVATLKRANNDLDAQLEAVDSAIAGARDMSAAVEGLLTDGSTRATLDAERKELRELADSAPSVDREDADQVAGYRDELVAQLEDLVAARKEVRASHEAWVKKENARRDQENADRKAAYDAAVSKTVQDRRAAYRAAVASNQSGWSGAPTGITYANGYLPSSQLCTLDFDPSYALQCGAAHALEAADDAYFAETGAHLDVISGYRSYSAQVATAASRGFYAAAPGTSNHGWGMAVDLGPSSAAWLRANGASYGWVHPLWARPGGSKPESWHLEFVAPQVSTSVAMPSKPTMLNHVSSVLGG